MLFKVLTEHMIGNIGIYDTSLSLSIRHSNGDGWVVFRIWPIVGSVYSSDIAELVRTLLFGISNSNPCTFHNAHIAYYENFPPVSICDVIIALYGA